MKKNWLNTNDELFQRIRKAVNKGDITNLMGFCSEDEYNPEVVDILNRCYFIDDIDEMEENIKDIFDYWFHNYYTSYSFYNIAVEIIEIFNEYKGV